MNTPDYRPPAQKFRDDLMGLIVSTYSTHAQGGESLKPGAHNIVTVVGGVQFTITIQEGRRR